MTAGAKIFLKNARAYFEYDRRLKSAKNKNEIKKLQIAK